MTNKQPNRNNNKNSMDKQSNKKVKKKASASKIIIMVMMLFCLEIILFSEFAMYKLKDLGAMYALVGVPVALAPTLISYMMKSKAENTEGGIVYESVMRDMNTMDGMMGDVMCNDVVSEVEGNDVNIENTKNIQSTSDGDVDDNANAPTVSTDNYIISDGNADGGSKDGSN